MVVDTPDVSAESSHANIQTIDCNDPLYVHPSDTPGISLVPELLIGTENYSEWSRSMTISLLVKNKLGFIDRTCTRAQYEKDNFRLRQWERCSAIVQSWIRSLVVPELRRGIVYSSYAQNVWKSMKDKFDKVNAKKSIT
uniref:Uncharacterized protein LOC104240091 n=1 Tax=Nicotiana sylvestris TaxID=4096 RepID=A0A1U7XQK3_NICSY|nr:PREDICTED: uncharacterized protein LOC104240091 [Nicotiana sylvestris]